MRLRDELIGRDERCKSECLKTETDNSDKTIAYTNEQAESTDIPEYFWLPDYKTDLNAQRVSD